MNGPGADPSTVTGLVIMTDLWEVWQPHLTSPQVSSYGPGLRHSGVRRPSLAPQTHSGAPLHGRPLLGCTAADENICDRRILERYLCSSCVSVFIGELCVLSEKLLLQQFVANRSFKLFCFFQKVTIFYQYCLLRIQTFLNQLRFFFFFLIPFCPLTTMYLKG